MGLDGIFFVARDEGTGSDGFIQCEIIRVSRCLFRAKNVSPRSFIGREGVLSRAKGCRFWS